MVLTRYLIISSSLLFISLFGNEGAAQRSACKIGTTTFACPDGFVKLPDVDSETRLFRLKREDLLYLFVAVPSGDFVDSGLKEALEKYYSGASSRAFQWNTVKNPLYMAIDTKYENKVSASFGFWDKHLLEFKFFIFSVNGKDILIGYVSDWGEAPWLNKRLFEKGEGLGDSAVGCNAVATLLNSITKEFKSKKQHCTISGSIQND